MHPVTNGKSVKGEPGGSSVQCREITLFAMETMDYKAKWKVIGPLGEGDSEK